ncbi:MAG: hypothetical protein ACREE6_18880 [Limisphaerales bacterium]
MWGEQIADGGKRVAILVPFFTQNAVAGNDKNIYVTNINKEHGEQARDANITIADAGFADAQVMSLTVPKGDVAAKTGATLGGAEIKSDGSWKGKWTQPAPAKTGFFTLTIPAASASIARLMEN